MYDHIERTNLFEDSDIVAFGSCQNASSPNNKEDKKDDNSKSKEEYNNDTDSKVVLWSTR